MDGDVVDFDPALCEELFYVSIRQSISEIPAHGEHDDFGWEPVAGEGGTIHSGRLLMAMNHLITLAEGSIDASTQQSPVTSK